MQSPRQTLCPDCFASPEQVSKRKAVMLKHNYGMSMEAFVTMLESQGHRCALCNEPFAAAYGQALGPAVDHNHTTGKVRAVTHGICNTRLGRFNDSVELLEQAVAYLRKHS